MIQGRRLVVKPIVNSSWGPEALASKNMSQGNKPWTNNQPMNPIQVPGRPPTIPPAPMGGGSFEPTNDCEIIVMSRALTTYAESIETRLKGLGMTVDLLFPNIEVGLGKVLSNISGRGCLYAILVTPLNEEHRSITVHILYGQPAEHRNMPIDDAISFIDKNFASYKEGQLNPSTGVKVVAHRHSDAIQQLLLALAENRKLTVLQYDTIINYLNVSFVKTKSVNSDVRLIYFFFQERRDVQIKEELGDAADKLIPARTLEEKLQEKILSILEKPTMKDTMKSIETETPEQVLTGGLEILTDLKVQRALDALLKSCITYK